MTNQKFENARSTNIEYDEIVSKKQRIVNKLLESNTENKAAYMQFCNYLKENEEVGLTNIEDLLSNAAIIFTYNYEKIKKLKNKEHILSFLSLIDKNSQDCQAIYITANYLLDDNVMKKLTQLSNMKYFEYFKEQLITTIVFRATHLLVEIDVMDLIKKYIKYYKQNVNKFSNDESKNYVRARA